jgi:NAD+ kinase
MIKAVAIIANPRRDNIKPAIETVIKLLKPRKVDILLGERASKVLGLASFVSNEAIYNSADLILALGGDGTVISAARIAGDRQIPLIGVHLGRLGFLAEAEMGNIADVLDAAFSGELAVQRRMRLECEIISASGAQIFKAHALNDIVLSKGAITNIVNFTLNINDVHMWDCRADGYIIATPTGSSAYMLAAGGPLISPELRLMALSPICPQGLTNRPLVMPADSMVKIAFNGERDDVFVSYDGQIGKNLRSGEFLLIRQASFDTVLYCVPDRNFFDQWQSKFGWGR